MRVHRLLRTGIVLALVPAVWDTSHARHAAGASRIPFNGVHADSCALSPVHANAYPAWRTALTIPWVQTKNRRIAGFLFFASSASGTDSLLRTHGTMPDGRSTKILWYVKPRGGASTLTIRGRNLTRGGALTQTVPRASSPPKTYPSIIDVPSAGCWRFTLTSGTVKGSVIMQVIDSVVSLAERGRDWSAPLR